MERNRVHILLVVITSFVLAIPGVVWLGDFKPTEKLKGVFVPKKAQEWSLKNWNSGIYQYKNELYLNDNIGLRPFFIRLGNQYQFSLFRQSNSAFSIIGKDDVLYQEHFINAITGKDFLGSDSINELARQFKFIQDSLSKKGVHLFFNICPGKASYFPEFIPDNIREKIVHPDSTNYAAMVRYFNKHQVNHIDMNRWFLEMKPKTEYPLYPKNDIHWGMYGAYVASDSLLKYLNKATNKTYPKLVLDSMYRTDTVIAAEEHLEKVLNLFQELEDYPMYYPKFHYENVSPSNGKTLVIADSYYLSLKSLDLHSKGFNESGDIYYFKKLVHDTLRFKLVAKYWKPSIDSLIQAHDAVMVLSSEGNFKNLGFGFIQELYGLYTNSPLYAKKKKEEWIENMISVIRNSKKWNEKIIKSAQELGKPYEAVLRQNAQYMYYTKFVKPKRTKTPSDN